MSPRGGRALAAVGGACFFAALAAGCAGGEGTPASPALPPQAPPTPSPSACGFETGLSAMIVSDPPPGLAAAVITLRAAQGDAWLDLVAPYEIHVPEGGANLDVPGLRPTAGVFASGFTFREAGECFEQSVRFEWVEGAGPLRLLVGVAGGASWELRCTPTSCDSS